MKGRYNLQHNLWDESSGYLTETAKKLKLEPEETMNLLQRQFAHTSEQENSGVYGNYDVWYIPSTTRGIEEWLTGKGREPYFRPKEKTSLYTGNLKISERVPAQCMTIRLPIGSVFKTLGIPVRYRAGSCPTRDDFGNPKLFDHMIFECFLDGKWKFIDPREPYRVIDPEKLTYPKEKFREFLTSYRSIELAGKDISLEMFRGPNGKHTEKQQIIRIVTHDLLNLANEPVVPWKVDTYYLDSTGEIISTRDPRIVERYDEIVQRLGPVLRNPDQDELERLKSENVVSYVFRTRREYLISKLQQS